MSTDLADLMERATASMPIDTLRLVNGGLDRAEADAHRRRWKAAGLAGGLAGAVVLAAVLVPAIRLQHESGHERDPWGPSSPASTLTLLPDDDLAARFAELLPGTADGLDPQRFSDAPDVLLEGLLTNDLGETGYVMGDFAVSDALPADAVEQSKQRCRESQRKVSDKDGTSCVLVDGGMIETWDDTVAPEDPADNAPGVRMAWVSFTVWDGASATMRALNTTENTVAPEPGAAPVLRTSELVDLVQQMEWYTPQ